jgi:hypothetical protein
MDEQSDAFAMLEIVQLSNGDIVLRDPDHGAEPLLRIQFSGRSARCSVPMRCRWRS